MKNEINRLVRLMAQDDTRAFREFFDLLYPRFYRFAFYYLKSEMLCEELVSDVFLKIWNNRKRLIFVDQLDFYFFRSIKNQALTYLKRESRNSLVSMTENAPNVEYLEPENLLIAKELAEKIEKAIALLPDKCQIIFRLVREDGLSYNSAAELLDISRKTVENQIAIAAKKIKDTLERHYQQRNIMKRILFFF